MTDIHHRIGVESSSTDDVYAALTTIDGLSGWWTTDTQGDPGLGGKIAFRFPQGGFDMEVIDLTPGELVEPHGQRVRQQRRSHPGPGGADRLQSLGALPPARPGIGPHRRRPGLALRHRVARAGHHGVCP